MLTRLVHLAARVRAMFRPAPLDRDLDAEFAAHVAMLAQEHIRRGMTPDAPNAPRGSPFGGVAAAPRPSPR